jgi:hypothetical protein
MIDDLDVPVSNKFDIPVVQFLDSTTVFLDSTGQCKTPPTWLNPMSIVQLDNMSLLDYFVK